MTKTIFDLSASTPDGKPYPFDTLRGRVVLVVNTATKCGLTPQFEGLEKLHQDYKDKGLAVIGFPCDQFAHQEPLTDGEMVEVCRLNHGVTFPLMAKSAVNGLGTNEVYKFLKGKTKKLLVANIKWNFAKFLVGRDGTFIKSFPPTADPISLRSDIERLLSL